MTDSTPNSNALEATVSEISNRLKKTVEDTFGYVRVRGEISGFRGPHSSGHCYFSLKDERAKLDAIIWRGQASKLKHMPEEGLEVIASGKLTTFPGNSKYQIVIDALEPAGAGALMALLEERRKKLGAEGLFDDERKKPLPYLPSVIGVVTSPTGAVIRDILHRITDRFPVHVMVWPVRVQGETSGREAANGVFQFNRLEADGTLPRPDVIIVARGGGSLEDLWGFNDEALVRSVAQSDIPVISAVGHETDWTLIDLVADWRAPTPTAAAERAVPVKAELEAFVTDLGVRLRTAMSRMADQRQTALRGAGRGLPTADNLLALPRRRFDEAAGRTGRGLLARIQRAETRYAQSSARLSVSSLSMRLGRANDRFRPVSERHSGSLKRLLDDKSAAWQLLASRVRHQPVTETMARGHLRLSNAGKQLQARYLDGSLRRKERVERAERMLDSLSYKNVLARGFAIVRDESGTPVRSAKSLKSGSIAEIEFHKDRLRVISSTNSEGGSPKKSPTPKGQKKEQKQGDLF